MARNLSSRRSNTIGVIVPKIAHFFFSSVIEAIYDAAFEHNYEIILTVSQENSERELKHIQSLLAMRVDGLIVSVSEQTKDSLAFDNVRKMGVPLTFMDRVMDVKGANVITCDDRGGALLATEQAIRIGYRRLAHLGGYTYTNIGRERAQGFQDAMKAHGLQVDPSSIVMGGFGEEDGYRGFMKLFNSGRRPEFILAVSYPVALGILRATRELGITIPRDVDVICFGNSPLNAFMSPRLTVVEQPVAALGRTSFEVTLQNIRARESFEPRKVQLATHLEFGDTCIPSGRTQ
jgi:LacI family transcriptional regulator